jgi:hypothetical protein
MKLGGERERVGIASAHAFAQTLGVFSEVFEGRFFRQLTRRHSDLLARA